MTATRLPPKSSAKPMTADEFWDFGNLPENENKSFELIRGEVVEMSRPTRQHGYICARFTTILTNWSFEVKSGYIASNDSGVLLERNPDTVVGPDVAYYTDANTFAEVHPRWGEFPSVLAVEVLSPNDRMSKVNAKIAGYLRGGVRVVWLVDYEDQKITVYRPDRSLIVLESADTIAGDPELPGFSCPVSEFFRMPGAPTPA
jgi:Uma2 family endonuclease